MTMNLLILGANSDVAYAVTREFAQKEHADFYLASRDLELLEKKVSDLKIRFQVNAKAISFDALDYFSHNDFYKALDPKPDGVVLAFGYLGDQREAQQNFKEVKYIIESNFLGAVSILEFVALDFERRGNGFIIGISSVAGERGRQSNYIYGSAKGALAVYLSGLRNRLYKRNVHVITVLPGFVRTKMTENMELPEKLMSSPEEIAKDIYRSFKKNKDIVYSKWLWKYIMLIIKILPEKIFKKLNL